MTHHVHGFVETGCNFQGRQSFVVGELHESPLSGFELPQELIHQLLVFACLPRERASRAQFHGRFKLLPAVKMVRREVTLPVESAMIGVLEKPYPDRALPAVEIGCCPKNAQENRLYYFFRFPRISYDADCDVEDEAMIPFEKDCEGVLTSRFDMLDQIFISCFLKILVKKLARLSKNHLGPSQEKK